MTSPATAPARDLDRRVLRPVDTDAGADAARMLVALHERVERQFDAYEAAEGSPAASYRAVGAIATALATHFAVEDELLYPALAAHTGRHGAEIERQLAQDHLLDLIMVELGGMAPTDRGYDAKVRVLMQVFRQHARDAETLIGQYLSRYLSPEEREQLGLRMLERVGQLEGRPRRGW
jgi:hemerythrin HHE cation binding domain-containing protein